MRLIVGLATILLAIGPANAQVTRTSTIDISERAVATLRIPGFVDFLVADGTAVWATNVGCIEKLELDSSQPTSVVKVPAPCGAMAVGSGSVWVANCSDDCLYRIDSASGKIRAVIKKVLLLRIDPKTNRVAEEFGPPAGSGAVRVAGGLVWVTAHDTKTVWVLRPGNARN